MNKKMDYNQIRNLIEKIGNENYRDLIKALVSYEKGINDENALDDIYDEFMDMDTKGLLHEDFDYMIDELRDKGEIDETIEFVPEKDDYVSVTGNLLKDAKEVIRKNDDGEVFIVCNATIVSEDENGKRVYTNASAFGEDTDILKDFKKGDFVKLTGVEKITNGENGKEFKNLRVVSSRLLKAKNQIKDVEEKNDSVIGAIKKFQEEDKDSKVENSEILKGGKIEFER